MDAFKEENKSGLDFEVFKLDAQGESYKQMNGPIKNIASTSQIIIYIVLITSAITLGLIIMLSIKGILRTWASFYQWEKRNGNS
ncbi:hypothetical protein JDS81_16015 [Bacillus cereus group sp. N31]|nr:hypothetical protein [Bacillus cereus group sp. N31]